jgi:signal transduction histidine kinase
LFRVRGKGDSRELYSFDEFGLSNTDIMLRKDFINGGTVMPEDAKNDPVAWKVIELKHEVIYVYKPESPDHPLPSQRKVEPIESVQGLPTFAVNYRYPTDLTKLAKSDNTWIEAPLLVGDRAIGKLTVSMLPQDLALPERWEIFRWAVLGAASALDAALRAEQEAQERVEQAWKETSEMAVHQLASKIPPAISFLRLTLQSLPHDPEAAIPLVSKAYRSLKTAQEILKDFRRYAIQKTFEDYENLTVPQLLTRIKDGMGATHPEANLEISHDQSSASLVVETSVSAVLEIVEILVRNSIMHSGLTLTDLNLSLRAKREAQATERAGPFLILEYFDNGKGISPSMRSTLFLPFSTDHVEGSGLGLAIARQFLHRLGGEIEEVGQKEHGVHFVIRVPSARKTIG